MQQPQKKKTNKAIIWIICVEIVVIFVGVIYILVSESEHNKKRTEDLIGVTESIPFTEVDLSSLQLPDICVPCPEIDEQLLSINKYSRPGKKTDPIRYIVIHYLANPGTTAQENRDYFESLKDLKDVSMSANYVIGIEGEIIRCVPEGEIAYASNEENHDSISIENCHKDRTGIFTEPTYESLVHLTAYLCDKYKIDRDHIIRHYDVTGKECPKYYVKHPKKWEEFKDDVMEYRQQWIDAAESELQAQKEKLLETEFDELAAYLESIAETDVSQ